MNDKIAVKVGKCNLSFLFKIKLKPGIRKIIRPVSNAILTVLHYILTVIALLREKHSILH